MGADLIVTALLQTADTVDVDAARRLLSDHPRPEQLLDERYGDLAEEVLDTFAPAAADDDVAARVDRLADRLDPTAWDDLDRTLGDDIAVALRAHLRAVLGGHLDVLARAVADTDRDSVLLIVGGHRLWVTGGTSWGDTPSDAFDTFWRLGECPVLLSAAGLTA